MDFPRTRPRRTRPRRSRTLIIIGRLALILLVSVAGLIVYSLWIEPNRLVVRQETIKPARWPRELSGLHVALISDVHTGSVFINEKKLHSIVDRTNAARPDLIVLLGDYMTG